MLELKSRYLACATLLLITSTSLVDISAQTTETNKCPPLLGRISRRNPNFCENVICENAVTEELCPPETIFMHNFTMCQCCPSCVKYLKPGEGPCVKREEESKVRWTQDPDCDPESSQCPVKVNQCLPGVSCSNPSIEHELYCKDDREVGINEVPVKPVDLSECLYRKTLYRIIFDNEKYSLLKPARLHHWDPKCEPDGSFSPKQCKGNYYSGECFCVNEDGARIFGREWRIQAENQTCACSRKVAKLRSAGQIASYHCTIDGNFEPLQCDSDSGHCYCVDRKTGDILGPVVPQEQWKLLPCYSLNITDGNRDGKYLRKCESMYAAYTALKIELRYHGTELQVPAFNCDYDGSYAPVRKTNLISECVYKNGTRIGNYIKQNAGADMTCNCARDVNEYFPTEEHPRQWPCLTDGSGNYDMAYDFGSYSACVDMDGFLYGEIIQSKYICCLLGGEGQSQCAIGTHCYNNENPATRKGIKQCSTWWPRRN